MKPAKDKAIELVEKKEQFEKFMRWLKSNNIQHVGHELYSYKGHVKRYSYIRIVSFYLKENIGNKSNKK